MTPLLERNARRAWLALVWTARGAGPLIPPPRAAQIEITNRCNMVCKTCTRLKLPHLGDMPYEDFVRLVDMLGGVKLLWLSGQGEPLLHRDLARMVLACADRGIRGTIVHTNGMLLDGEIADALAASGLGELKISIDGGSAADVEYLREGAEMARILENVRRFTARRTVRTSFYCVLNRRNQGSAHLLPALAAGAGVRRIEMVETVPFRDETTEREIFDRREYQFTSLPRAVQRETIARVRKEALRHGVDVGIQLKWYRKRCFEPFDKIYVDFRGNVTPCCRIHNEVMVGNILRDGLQGSWYGAEMNRWRRDLLRRDRNRRICVERCNLGIGAGAGGGTFEA